MAGKSGTVNINLNAVGIKPYGVFHAHFLLSAENCIKKGGKSAVPSPLCHEPKGAWMFSHVENIGGIQTEETPKINTFQTMRKEVSGMAVFRIEKTRDYTVMSNHHLRNTDLSLKAKGLLSLINSPSRVTRKSGGFAGQGFVLGVLDYAAKARDAGSVVATTSLKAMSNALSNMADYLSMNMDSVPTIRPVMDLSDIQSGIRVIGSMFSATRGIDVSPMTDSVSSAIPKPNRHDRNAGDDSSDRSQTVLNFNQYNNSPKSLSRIEIYRQTHNIVAAAKEALSKA